jgi:hypothetical protein
MAGTILVPGDDFGIARGEDNLRNREREFG